MLGRHGPLNLISRKEKTKVNIQEKQELQRIYERDGSLDPHKIIIEARNPENPLHDRFTWDKDKAAYENLLNEARKLIRIAVTILPQVNNEPVRAYVSLSPLRKKDQGSYIAMVDILSEEERYAQAREDALGIMSSMQKRFNYIRELSPVWDALALVLADVEKLGDKVA